MESGTTCLAASLPWPAILLDDSGRVTFQNPAARQLQERPDEATDGSLAQLYPQRFAVLSGGAPWCKTHDATYLCERDGAAVRERLWMIAIPDHGALLIIMDDTAAYEGELAKAQTDRLASIGFMLAGVCHEVSNPLAATYSMVQLLESQSDLTENMLRSGLEKISANVRRILDVSRTVYEFARVSELKPLPVDLPIEEAFDLLAPDDKFAQINVVHRPDYGALIQGDLIHLRQVFFNLALNAAQAMQGCGDISVTTDREQIDRIVIVFEDTGPGISVERREQIFEPFFTTKASGKGTGLGLSIVRDVIREHGGTIRVEDRVDGGARFILDFPVMGAER